MTTWTTSSPTSWATGTWPSGWPPTTSDYRALAERDRRNIEHLANEMRTRAVIEVPYLDFDVHDLAGLMEVNRYLFATGAAERAELAASA